MKMDDCFEIGKQSYLNEEYVYAIDWMWQAYKRFNESVNNFQNISEIDIAEYYLLAHLKIGGLK